MENSALPLVSVHLLTYNQKDTIAQTLDSVLMQQTVFKYDIVVGDDFSTDGTREILTTYKERYPDKIVLIFREKNLGLIENTIDTFHHCQGEYIAMIEGDDYWIDPLKLQKQVDILREQDDVALVHTDFNRFYVDENRWLNDEFRSLGIVPPEKYDQKYYMKHTFIRLVSVCFRASELRGFEDVMRAGWLSADAPLFLYLSKNKYIVYLNESTSVYREYGDSISHPNDTFKRCRFLKNINTVWLYMYDYMGYRDSALKQELKQRFYDNAFYYMTMAKQCPFNWIAVGYKLVHMRFSVANLKQLVVLMLRRVGLKAW